MAVYRKWTSTVLVNGQPEPNVKVYVHEPGTTNEIPIYEDEGVTQITQPILTDSQGRYAFFVDVDAYPEIRLYLEKDGVDFSEANEDLDGVPVPGAGGGAGTFLELTDTPSSYVGRGGDVVMVKNSEDGIETQPWPVTGTVLNVFLSATAADVGSYYYMYSSETGGSATELTSSSLSTGDDQLLWSFVTEAGEPGIDQLALGVYTATLFLKKTGNKDVRLYWKLFKRDTGGTETEILQSAVSDYLTTDNSQYLISGYLNEDQALDPTDRLVLKLYANVSGTGTDVTVTLTMEGDYDSRLAIHVLSSAFDLDRLSDVTLSSPSDNEMLVYDAASEKWTNQTPEEAGVLASDGSVPLTGDWDTGGFRISNLKSLNFKDATTLTISSGAVTVSQSYHYVDTEGGAASDDLDTISGGTAGDILCLRSADSSCTVIIKHGTGNIVTPDGTDYSLDSTDKVVALLFDGTNWHLVGAAGGGTGGASTFLDLTDTPSSYSGYAKFSPVIKDDETGLGWQSFADMELESRTIYVDADNGSDITGDGSEGNPFKTYEKALSTVRNVIADGVTVTIHLKAATNQYTMVDTGRFCIGSGELIIEGELAEVDSGMVSSGDALTITDSSKSWTTDEHKKRIVKFVKGSNEYWRVIASNTGTSLTVVGRLDETPASGDSYTIYDFGTKLANNPFSLLQGNITLRYLAYDSLANAAYAIQLASQGQQNLYCVRITAAGDHGQGDDVWSVKHRLIWYTQPGPAHFDMVILDGNTYYGTLLHATAGGGHAFISHCLFQATAGTRVVRGVWAMGTVYLEGGLKNGANRSLGNFYSTKGGTYSSTGILIGDQAMLRTIVDSVNGGYDRTIIDTFDKGMAAGNGAIGTYTGTAYVDYINCDVQRTADANAFALLKDAA